MNALWHRLALLQTRHPGRFVLLFALLSALGAWRASHLEVVTDFADLLSPDQPSVVEMRRILARVRGLSSVLVVLEGPDATALRAAADALAPPLRAIGGPHVETARSGIQEARRFLLPRAGLYLTPAELDELEGEVRALESAAFKRAVGADLDPSEDPPTPAPSALLERLTRRLGPLASYPDGYYQGRSGSGAAALVMVKSAVASGDLAGARAALDRIRQVATATLARWPEIRVGYTGDLVTMQAEYGRVRADILDVGVVGVALILAAILVFFRTPRALLALGATIGAGCAVTFGLTERVLGHLNVATAFLLSIVAGNGVNFAIIWLARFLDERRRGQPLAAAVEAALARTQGATLAAACAAAAAYGALAVAGFRGFRHFAFIGASGMLACWLASYLLLPAVVVLLERPRAGLPRATAHFERPFLWLAQAAPGATLLASLAITAAALVAGGLHLGRGPMEYDMRRLQSDPQTTSELYRLSSVASAILGPGSGAMVVLTDDPRDTPVAARLLREARDRAPAGARPFQEVRTLDDLVPSDQAARLARVRALAARLERARDREAIDEASWAKLAPLLPPPDLRPFGAGDLPAQLLELFTERDGSRGRILFIEPTVGQSDSDLRYLLRWADAFRQTRLPDGRVIDGSGRAVIFADLLRASLVDMPRSVALSLAMTALAVALLFRRLRPTAAVVGSLALALVWMLGAMGAAGVRISFMNFIALPITFGIGVDYAVNVCGRYEQDPDAGMAAALRGAGGAVILCSLTTSLGYLALLRAQNAAVRSLGAVAVLGEVTCLATAVLVLPAFFIWRERRLRRPGSRPAAAA